jgi:hypothetical protein
MARRRRKRIAIVKTSCKRCGKPLFSTNRSIHGASRLHAKYAGICSVCTTEEEKEEMLYGIGSAILKSAR